MQAYYLIQCILLAGVVRFYYAFVVGVIVKLLHF